MILNDVTMRNYGRWQALLNNYDTSTFKVEEEGGDPISLVDPLVKASAVVRAAREAGIADALPEPLDKGDPLDLPPTDANREALYVAAAEIAQHITEATRGVSGE